MSFDRFDIGTLRKPRLKANGFKEYDAFATRSGVFVYRNADGSQRREYRPPSEVFRSDTLQSLASVPVTDDHPPKMLTPETAREYTRGAVSPNVSREENKVRTSFVVYDKSLQTKMDSGKNAISLGYRCDVDFTPGTTPEGEPYDAMQSNIVYNHLAVVDKARAGESIQARVDSAYTEIFDTSQDETLTRKAPMKLLRIDGVDFEVSEQVYQALEKERKDKQAELDKLQARADAAEEKAKKASERADAATDPKAIDAKVKSRVVLEVKACKFLPEEKTDGLGDRELQDKIAIKLGVPADALKGKSDEYAKARFDAACEEHDKRNDGLDNAHRAAETNTPQGRTDAETKAKTESKKYLSDRWKELA